jgi:hypothetical protein
MLEAMIRGIQLRKKKPMLLVGFVLMLVLVLAILIAT